MADRMLVHDMKSNMIYVHCRSNSSATETVSSGYARTLQVRLKLDSPMDLIVNSVLITLEMLQVPLSCYSVLWHGERYEYKRPVFVATMENMVPSND
jgi:hypothetical protein